MKKIIPLLLLMVFVDSCVKSQPEKHQVEVGLFTPAFLAPEILNGQVKEIYERNYFANEDAGTMMKGERLTLAGRDSIGWTLDFHVICDEDGQLLQSEEMDENDKPINRSVLSYEEGRMVKAAYYENDTLKTLNKPVYDETGRMNWMERYRVPEDTLVFKAQMIRDANGNIVEWDLFNPDNELTGKDVFSLDENGKRTGYRYFNKDGEQTFEQQYSYNDMGNWILCKGKSSEHPDIVAERIISYFEK